MNRNIVTERSAIDRLFAVDQLAVIRTEWTEASGAPLSRTNKTIYLLLLDVCMALALDPSETAEVLGLNANDPSEI